MATTRFATTMKALEGGAKGIPVDAAISNIEGWEDYLSKHDHEGAKKVAQDLGKLKKMLQGDAPDDAAISKLLEKLSKDTIAVAGDAESATATHIKELGEALAK